MPGDKPPTTLANNRRLRAAHAVWGLFALATAATFAKALPVRFEALQSDPFFTDFIIPGAAIGITPRALAFYITGIEVAFGLVYMAVGLVTYTRKSDDWMVILYTLTLIASGVFSTDFGMPLRDQGPFWRTIYTLLRALTYTFIVLVHYLFPNGRLQPRWTVLLAPLWAAFTLSWLVAPQLIPPSNHISVETTLDMLMLLVLALALASAALAQLSRLRGELDPVARQQTKWVVFGFAMTAAGLGLSFLPPVLFSQLRVQGMAQVIYVLIAVPFTFIAISMTPLSLAFSILRYRLWEIDQLINRALVYGTLTGTLILVYLGTVLAIQLLLQAFTPMAGYDVSTVFSTLVIAALFNPLRRRFQTGIDRRFYRRRYDVEQTLADFGAELREQVDLDSLSQALVAVVEQTMQPKHAGLWLIADQGTTREPPGNARGGLPRDRTLPA